MPKVRETQTQDHLREKVTHLNLADYLYDLEAIAKETGKPEDLKVMPESELPDLVPITSCSQQSLGVAAVLKLFFRL